jgi:hypothetical protein
MEYATLGNTFFFVDYEGIRLVIPSPFSDFNCKIAKRPNANATNVGKIRCFVRLFYDSHVSHDFSSSCAATWSHLSYCDYSIM